MMQILLRQFVCKFARRQAAGDQGLRPARREFDSDGRDSSRLGAAAMVFAEGQSCDISRPTICEHLPDLTYCSIRLPLHCSAYRRDSS
jgi:hypothetical protein